MKGNRLIITDYVRFTYMDPSLMKIRDFFGDKVFTAAGNQNGLIVKIAATHAGVITRNNTFYLPDKVRDSIHTFTKPYQKPVLRHHKTKEDAIGRIIDAEYIDTSGAMLEDYDGKEVKDSHGKVIATINKTLIRDFCDGNMPHGMQIDIVRNVLEDAVLNDLSYQGLGFAQINAKITDEDAIKKFLDGRYLTGSVGAATDSATCSVCKQNWMTDGMCDHKPGGKYEGHKMYIIAGRFEYGEYSVANKPADRHSQVLELHYNGVRDYVDVVDSTEDSIYEINPQFYALSDSASEESNLMGTENKKDEKSKEEVKDNIESTNKTNTGTDTSKTADSTAEGKTKDNEPKDNETKDNDANKDQQESFDDFVTRITASNDTPLSDEDDEKMYAIMLDEMKELGLSEKDIEDAKLTTAKRKSLAKSQFCGPNRSFPVNDCAHVTAARRLIDRVEISSSTKSSMLACVSRKEKVLDCKTASETSDSVDNKNINDDLSHARLMRQVLNLLEEDQYFSDNPSLEKEELKTLQNILTRLSKLVTKDSLVDSCRELGLVKDDEKQLLDEIISLEEKLGSINKQVKELSSVRDALRQEYNDLYNDVATIQDDLVKEKDALRKEREGHLSLLKNLEAKEIKKELKDEISNLSDEVLITDLERVSDNVDINQITDKLGDGTSRVPTGNVDDPTNNQDNDKKSFTDEEVKKELKDIQDIFMKSVFRDSYQANIWKEEQLARMVKEGKIPELRRKN